MSLLTSKQRRAFWWFWTEPTSGHTSALFRVSYGLLATWTSLGILFNFRRFYSDKGMLPWRFAEDFPEQALSIISILPESDALVLAIATTSFVASACMTLGFQARKSALLICAIQITLQHRNPYIVNGGDRLFLIMAGLAALLPLSKQWSIDAWRDSRRAAHGEGGEPSFSSSTVWSQRLMALQLSHVYLVAFGAKMGSPIWRDGTALFAVMASPRLAEWPLEIHIPLLIAVMTWGTVVFEIAFPLLVWFRKYRPYLILAGIVFHMGIEITMTIPMFSVLMVISYLPFLSDEESRRLVSFLLRCFSPKESAPPDALAPSLDAKKVSNA